MEYEEYGRQLDELEDVIVDGIGYFSAWRGLMAEVETSLPSLNRYNGFFVYVQTALRRMTLLQFAKVFDPDQRTVSFTKLLAIAMKDRQNLIPHATEDSLRRMKAKTRAYKETLDRLKEYRDQRIAHHDAIVSCDFSTTYGELCDLIEDTKAM